MLNNVIDPVTGQPRKLGELFNDRNIRLVGEMRWDSAVNKVDTRNLRIISTPNDGGAPAITVIPDGSYTLSAANTSIWIELRRTAGTTTVVLGTSLIADVSSQDKPRPNWIQLFVRTSTNDIVTLGNWLVLAAPQWTKAGVTRGTAIYDAIVGTATNPFATHTTIQGAIDDALDGDRILVLAGTYNLTGPGNSVISSSAALSWSGKTLTIEGEGYGTIIQNAGSMTTAFYIRSTSSSTNGTLGNGSRVLSMQLRNLPQVVVFDGGSANGVRNCNLEVYSSGFGVSTAPAKAGTGNFGLNTVREMIITTGAISQIRETVVGPDIQTRIFDNSTGNEFLDSTGTRRLAIKTALKVGDVSSIASQALDVVGNIRTTTGLLHTPSTSMNIIDDGGSSQNLRAKTLLLSTNISSAATQSLDVVGNIRTTTGILHTPAVSMNVVDDAGASQNIRARTLLLSTNISSAASQSLDVVGNIRTTTGILHTPAVSMNIVDDAGALHNLKAKSLVLSTASSDSANTQSALIRGSLQVDGSTILGTNTSQTISLKSPTTGYGIIPLGAVIATLPNLTGAYNCTASTVPDANGFVTCVGQTVNDPGGPMNGVTVPNINNKYFIMGATSNIGTLAAEESTFTNPVYRVPSHSHNWSLSATGSSPGTDGQLWTHSHTVGDHGHDMGNHYHGYDHGNWHGAGGSGQNERTVTSLNNDVPSGTVEIQVQGPDNPVVGGYQSSSLFYRDPTGTPSTNSTGGSSPGTSDVQLNHSHTVNNHGHGVSGSVGSGNNVDTTTVNASLTTGGSISNFRPSYISARYIMRVR